MKKIALFLTLFSAASAAKAIPVEYDVNAYPSYATANDFNAYKNTTRVDELCPSTKADYGANLEQFQSRIDSLNPQQCYGSIKLWGKTQCILPGYVLIYDLDQKRIPVELCFELRTMEEGYALALASSAVASAEDRREILASVDALGVCLKAAAKRSEIENCYISFQQKINTILAN